MLSEAYKIIPLSDEYLEQAAEIEKLCFSEPWSQESLRRLYTADGAAGIACVDVRTNTLTGFGGLVYCLDEGEIATISVRPDYRRQGIAGAIFGEMLGFMKERGILRVTLEVRVSNAAARSLYEKYGFSACGIRKRFYRFPAEDAVVMEKEL